MSDLNNSKSIDICTRRITAINDNMPAKTTIGVEGTEMDMSDILGSYQASLDARADAITARAQLNGAIARRVTADASRKVTDRALRAWVVGKWGEGSPQALAFGFPARKKPGRTVASKAHAVALGLATREARGTLGKKQKAKIRGVLPEDASPAVTSTGARPAHG